MHEPSATAPRSAGYVVVLLGLTGFVVGCFLPYSTALTGAQGSTTVSLYQLVVESGETFVQTVGGLLYLFAAVATLAVIAVAGLGGRRWAPVALAAVTVAWSLWELGILLFQSRFVSQSETGYWVLLISILVVAAGAVLVWVSARAALRDRTSPSE
jgi:hypothetical protein